MELSRKSYEIGEWADAVQEAWHKGRDAKMRKRREGETGRRVEEGRMMATDLVEWVHQRNGIINAPVNSSQASDLSS